MQEVDRLGWAATTAFRVGEWAIGVRSNTLELDELLRSALAAHVLDGVEAPRNYSIAVHSDEEGGIRPLSALWWQYSILLQSRFPERVLRSLVGYMSEHLDRVEAAVRVPAITLVGPGGAVLAHRALGNYRPRLNRLVRKYRLGVLDSRSADIGDDGELLVSPPSLEVNEDALAPLEPATGRPPSGPDLTVSPGRYPIRGWLLRMPISAPDPSRARAVSTILSGATDGVAQEGQRALDALSSSVGGATVRGFWAGNLEAVESALEEISG